MSKEMQQMIMSSNPVSTFYPLCGICMILIYDKMKHFRLMKGF